MVIMMNIEISIKEARDLIKSICTTQVQLVKDNPKRKIYESDYYKRLEELKVKLKAVR